MVTAAAIVKTSSPVSWTEDFSGWYQFETHSKMKKRSETRKHCALPMGAVRPPSVYQIWSGLLNLFKSY